MHIEKRHIKLVQSLAQKKYRNEHKKFVLEGYKLIQEALNSNVSFDFIVYNKELVEKKGYESLLAELQKRNIEIYWAHESELEKISNFSTSDGVLAVAKQISLGNDELGDSILVFDQLNDPGNLGTIIRTADWFGIDAIVLGEGSVDMYNPKVVRASMGSLFRVLILTQVDLKKFLNNKKSEYQVFGTSLQGELLDEKGTIQFQKHEKKIFLFGSESHGLGEDLENVCHSLIKIPGGENAESLNLGISAGIIMYQFGK